MAYKRKTLMHQKHKPGCKVFLWCDGRDQDHTTSAMKHNSQEGSVNKWQATE